MAPGRRGTPVAREVLRAHETPAPGEHRRDPTGKAPLKNAEAHASTPTVVVIGESLVDIVDGPQGNRTCHPGGSPLNVAVGLGRLDVSTELATRIGDDPHGELIRRHLTDAGVTLQAGSRGADRTATAHASIGADGSATYEFDIAWDLSEVHFEAPRVVHTGSLATLLEPGASRIEEALRRLPDSTLITFDPNIRPALATSRETTRTRVEDIAALAHIVKMSNEDAAWLYPDTEPRAIAERYASRGAQLFVLTRAENGCMAASHNTLRYLQAEPATVVDTIGAGDAFMSGLIYEAIRSGAARQLTARESEEELLDVCVQTALRSAAITVSRAGANPPNRHDLNG